jgi:hypothetical protein
MHQEARQVASVHEGVDGRPVISEFGKQVYPAVKCPARPQCPAPIADHFGEEGFSAA